MAIFPRLTRKLYLASIGSIAVPAIVLTFLSVRSIKDEQVLVERNVENRIEALRSALTDALEKSRSNSFQQLRDRLKNVVSSPASDQAAIMAADLLNVPIVQSVVVLRQDEILIPRLADDAVANSPPEKNGNQLSAIREVQKHLNASEWSLGLRAVRLLLHGADSLKDDSANAQQRFGFRLLEIKSLALQHQTGEAATLGRVFIRDILASKHFQTPFQTDFLLREAILSITALEDLPMESRSWYFTLHQKLDILLRNSISLQKMLPIGIEDWVRRIPLSQGDSLTILDADGIPILVLGYPWLDAETRVIAILDESYFERSLEQEARVMHSAAFRDIEFSLSSSSGKTFFKSDSNQTQPFAIHNSFLLGKTSLEMRLSVQRKGPEEVQRLGRERLGFQYILLALALAALTLGSISVFTGLNREHRMVRMKSNFLSAVSHELKTPLTSIRMFSEMLHGTRQLDEEKSRRYAQLISQEADRLGQMIDGILQYTRLEDGRVALNFVKVDLGTIAKQTADMMQAAFQKAEIDLIREIPETASMLGDEAALRSVIQNLLENALKYSNPGTRVRLSISVQPKQVILTVADQGIGIRAEDLPRIFERFFRAGDEMTRSTRGSGLGLAIVKQIVDAHRAQIEVTSRHGEGTTMTVLFPKES